MPGVRKLGPASVALKLSEFALFDEFFLDLADFRDLDVFWPFDFPDFLVCSTSSSSYSLISLSPLSLREAGLLLLFLLGAGSSSDSIVFNIEVNRTAILLKP